MAMLVSGRVSVKMMKSPFFPVLLGVFFCSDIVFSWKLAGFGHFNGGLGRF